MKKTYHVSIIPSKVQTIRVRSRIVMGLVVKDEITSWACPEERHCQRAFRLWRNLADSEMPVSGQVVIRLIDILDRAFDGARERGYAFDCLPSEYRWDAPIGINPRALYVLWRDVFPTYKGRGLFLGFRRV